MAFCGVFVAAVVVFKSGRPRLNPSSKIQSKFLISLSFSLITKMGKTVLPFYKVNVEISEKMTLKLFSAGLELQKVRQQQVPSLLLLLSFSVFLVCNELIFLSIKMLNIY